MKKILDFDGVTYLWNKILKELNKKATKEELHTSLNGICYSDETDTIIIDGGSLDD
jgi:glutamine cyclotransferase